MKQYKFTIVIRSPLDVKDMVWAFLARYTTVSFWFLVVGILAWSFLTAVLVNIPPLNKLKNTKK